MKRKVLVIALTVALATTAFVGCGKKEVSAPKADAVTTASIVNKEDAFLKAISKDGTWIIATLNDLTFTQELVLDGEFKNTKTPPVSARKLAPYTQKKDDNGKNVVVDRFTITAPKLTIKSPDARIQAGTFKGDVYVEAQNFQLVDATVEGNVYFLNEDAQKTYKVDEKSKVTGVTELKK